MLSYFQILVHKNSDYNQRNIQYNTLKTNEQ